MNVSKILKLLIEKNKLNTLELSRMTGIGQPVIYRILSGETKDPKLSTVCSLADFFGISVNQMIGSIPLEDNGKKTGESRFSVPVVSWVEVCEWANINEKTLMAKEVIYTEIPHNKNLFALSVDDDAMEPLFPRGTVLVVDSTKKARHCSYIIAKKRNMGKAIFRQIVIDEDVKYLKPLNPDSAKYKINFLEKEDLILGVLLQARKDYRR